MCHGSGCPLSEESCSIQDTLVMGYPIHCLALCLCIGFSPAGALQHTGEEGRQLSLHICTRSLLVGVLYLKLLAAEGYGGHQKNCNRPRNLQSSGVFILELCIGVYWSIYWS